MARAMLLLVVTAALVSGGAGARIAADAANTPEDITGAHIGTNALTKSAGAEELDAARQAWEATVAPVTALLDTAPNPLRAMNQEKQQKKQGKKRRKQSKSGKGGKGGKGGKQQTEDGQQTQTLAGQQVAAVKQGGQAATVGGQAATGGGQQVGGQTPTGGGQQAIAGAQQAAPGGTSSTGLITMWTKDSNKEAIASSSCLHNPFNYKPKNQAVACAVSADLFQEGKGCGKCYKLTYDGSPSAYNGIAKGTAGSATVEVINSGAGGTQHFDCLEDVFKKITGTNTDGFPIQIQPIDCR